jgi:two-component system, chemotaxis family, protein-glutamate methylesterase/glutaminase
VKTRRAIRVLVVEDSPTVREFLVHVLNSAPDIEVIGTAANGEEALEAVLAKKPDAITMDIHMPRMDGLEATRRIMETHPTPIIIVSANIPLEESAHSFAALEAGALALIRRPSGLGNREHERTSRELVRTVKLMSEVKVVKRWPQPHRQPNRTADTPHRFHQATSPVELIAIGGSTGAPSAIETILSGLPKHFRIPILVVQHMATGFIGGFVEWLAQSSGRSIHVASSGEPILPGHVYVAPDGFHLGVHGMKVLLSDAPPEHGLRPAVSFLFRSVALHFGARAAGVLLSGMGRDGADSLLLMRQKDALTIAQDEESSVVHSMPGEAIKLGAASHVLSPEMIAAALSELPGHNMRQE